MEKNIPHGACSLRAAAAAVLHILDVLPSSRRLQKKLSEKLQRDSAKKQTSDHNAGVSAEARV